MVTFGKHVRKDALKLNAAAAILFILIKYNLAAPIRANVTFTNIGDAIMVPVSKSIQLVMRCNKSLTGRAFKNS